jgi:hypothetical protein
MNFWDVLKGKTFEDVWKAKKLKKSAVRILFCSENIDTNTLAKPIEALLKKLRNVERKWVIGKR